ncbi:YqjF family protein [Salinibacterium soli]|uniref:DUF2071 domain-containing protein n=1 Tax=Antiquaquibacter soli TaxID=3064523 RepID=A0ABT9BM28_9MICO|nr:DUF2071 domain-containing protein [Protaetiibacter sp. WY-16]MDO7882060.1 DUF2071 domain-containing protein [Protaetiibacter sp. WY-16]
MIEPIDPAPPGLPGRVVASQQWRDVTFLHWRSDPATIAPLLPAGCRPDIADGATWVGLIAFQLARATLGPSPAIPYFGSFTEVNVRLYAIDASGRRGVVFLSLEASRLAAVVAARMAFSIPYFWSSTSLRRSADAIEYRADRHVGAGHSRLSIRPGAPLGESAPLDDFLTARWGLFARRWGRTHFLPNSHERWQLHSAELLSLDDSLLAAAGVPVSGAPESVLFSPGVTARFGRPRPVPAG